MVANNSTILFEFIEQIDTPYRIINDENHIIYMNKKMMLLFGNLLGEQADIIFTNEDSISHYTPRSGKRTRTVQIYIGEALYKVTSYHVKSKGKEYIVETFNDITEQKRTEAQLKNSYNKLLKDTKFARSIQYSVLPIDDIYWGMIKLNATYLPADDLGGDMFDIVKLNEDEMLMYMADVSGHGIRAALLTIFLREVVRGMADIARSQGLDQLLESLLKHYTSLDIDAEMYFSIVLCKYNRNTKELSLANAGHNCFPLVLRKNGRIEEVPIKGMPITKIGISTGYDEETVGIYPGDRILLYTDGIIEEFSETEDKEFGVEGVRRASEKYFDLPGDELSKKIIQEAEKFSRTKAKDDRSIMVATIL